jgi:hypothetical protein
MNEERASTAKDIISPPNRTLVLVEWDDSQSVSKWHHEDELNDDYILPVIRSVGYIVQERESYITLSPNTIFYENVSNQISCIMSIPRGCIRSITTLRKGKPYAPKGKDG